MKKHKKRTAIYRKTNRFLMAYGRKCIWWDDGCPECMLPWAYDKPSGCEGNPFKCKKLFYKYLASAQKPSSVILYDFMSRNEN